MTVSLSQYELPAHFVRRFHPVRVERGALGLAGYVFDHQRMQFFQRMVTGEPVSDEAVWSVVKTQDNSVHLQSGAANDAVGYVITEIPSPEPKILCLPKRLSHRQKIQAATLNRALDLLQGAAISVPAAVLEIIRKELDASSGSPAPT